MCLSFQANTIKPVYNLQEDHIHMVFLKDNSELLQFQSKFYSFGDCYYDSSLLTKVIAEIWEHCDYYIKFRQGKIHKWSDDQTDWKQANSLNRLSTALSECTCNVSKLHRKCVCMCYGQYSRSKLNQEMSL